MTRIHAGVRGQGQTFCGRMTRISPGAEPGDAPLSPDPFHVATCRYRRPPSRGGASYFITLGFTTQSFQTQPGHPVYSGGINRVCHVGCQKEGNTEFPRSRHTLRRPRTTTALARYGRVIIFVVPRCALGYSTVQIH